MQYLLLGLYFSSLVSFSFVHHPIGYCLLLLLGALGSSGFAYCVMGFSWYLLLFCLVYVGGVYILFIYVSIFSSNALSGFGGGWFLFLASFVFFSTFFFGLGDFLGGFKECSHHLCSAHEGFTYCVFCLVLLVAFVIVSIVGSDKGSFFR